MRTFLTIWDTTGGGVFTALIRSVASHEEAARMLREFFVKHDRQAGAGSRRRRTSPSCAPTLVASQLVGMGMVRYVAQFEPLASRRPRHDGRPPSRRTLQRYITGDHHRRDVSEQHVGVEAGAVAGVAGRALLVDDQQHRVAVAVQPDLVHVLGVPGGLALDPYSCRLRDK